MTDVQPSLRCRVSATLLLRHDALVAARLVRNVVRRRSDLFVLATMVALAVLAFVRLWEAAGASRYPAYLSFALIGVWVLAWATARLVQVRLAWFEENTPFSAEAQSRRGRRSYFAAAFGLSVLLLGFPAVLLLATAVDEPWRVPALALVAAAGGVFHARVRDRGDRAKHRTTALRRPVRATGERLLAWLVTSEQLSLGGLRPASRRSALLGAALLGLILGAAALAIDVSALRPLGIAAAASALLALILLTRVNQDVVAVARPLGFTSLQLARFYLAAPWLFAAAFLIPVVAMRPPSWLLVCLLALAVASIQSLPGLLVMLRGRSGGPAAMLAQLEVGILAAIAYVLPPAGAALVVWRLARAVRRHDADRWSQH